MGNSSEDPRPLVMIVDDEPDLLRLIEICLKAQPIQVEAFHEGKVLLERLARAPNPQLIILDVMMPVLSGYEVCRALRALPGCDSIPVVFLTAKTQARDYVLGLESGGNYYIEKPFDVEKIGQKVLGFLAAGKGE